MVGKTKDELPQAWLPVLLQGSFSEIYVLDCTDLRFLEVNQAAQKNLQYAASELAKMHVFDIVQETTTEAFTKAIKPLQEGLLEQASLNTIQVRRDGSIYPVELRLFYVPSCACPAIIAIGNDISARYASANALRTSMRRFHVIVANTPGMVFQCLLKKNGDITFPYLSDGCHALLGISPEQLHENPALFLNLIIPDDRASYLESMAVSAAELKAWNWEGRIWIEQWHDIKWINLRSTPRALIGDDVQWEGIMTNITQSKQEEAEIKRSRKQLAELTAHVDKVKEQERTRISREIHDDLGGNLTAIKMALALLTKRLPSTDAAAIEKAHYVDALVDRTIDSIHRIAGDLRPGILDFGIVEAINWQAREFEKQAGISCVVKCNKKTIALDPDQATALFRIFQETLTNISKHAQATRVEVNLTLARGRIALEVRDNGIGIGKQDQSKPNSFGIRGMIERTHALGGELSIAPIASGGCVVKIRIPVVIP